MTDRYASLKQGLVGCWIPSVSGSGLLLPDLSGRGNNGTLTGMDASDWVSSQYGRALDFDGSNDYVTASDRGLPTGDATVSISHWVNIKNTTTASGVFGYGTSGVALSAIKTIINVNAGQIWLAFAGGNNARGPTLQANRWYHVCFVKTPGAINTTTSIYLDGVLQTIGAGSSTNTPNIALSSLTLGVFDVPSNDFAPVLLDDCRIYNRALSEPEIRLLASEPGIGFKRISSSAFATRYAYKPDKPRNYSVIRNRDPNYSTLRHGLVAAYCPSISGQGNVLPDLVGGNHGTLTNMDASDWVSGQYGRALDFDGSDDRIVASGNTSFTNGVVSVSGWMRRTGTAGVNNAVVFSKGTLEGNANSTCALYWNEVQGWSWFIVDAANNLTIVRSNTVTSQSQWVHIAGVASPAGVFLYLNGVLANSTTTAAVKNSTHESFIGGASIGGGTFASLLGQADDIRAYNRALTEPEIKLLASKRGIGLRQESHRNTFYQFPSGARRKRILTGMP